MTRRAGLGPLLMGSLAMLAGLAFLVDVGALSGMASRNAAAFLAGLFLGWAAHHLAHRREGAVALFALATALLAATLLFGREADGVRRWLDAGPVTLQPALIVAPLLLAIAAGREGRRWRLALLVPLALVALQPDGATAAALAAGIAAAMGVASHRSKRGWTRRRIALAAGALTLAALTLLLSGIQTPPPVAFVEGTAQIARLSGPLAIALHVAAATWAIAAMLLGEERAGVGLAAYFAVAMLAALFWAFPMPVVGAGPSHLIGFGLATGWLTVAARNPHRRPWR